MVLTGQKRRLNLKQPRGEVRGALFSEGVGTSGLTGLRNAGAVFRGRAVVIQVERRSEKIG